jgi:hypothetical protein
MHQLYSLQYLKNGEWLEQGRTTDSAGYGWLKAEHERRRIVSMQSLEVRYS